MDLADLWGSGSQGPGGQPPRGETERLWQAAPPPPAPRGSGTWVPRSAPHAACLFQPNSSNDNIQSITSGDWDVTKILSYDEKRNKM